LNHRITRFLTESLGNARYRLEQLHGDGSERRFFRVHTPERTYILLEHFDGGTENDSYYVIGNHLQQRSIPVPRFYAHDPQGMFLMEDLGDEHLFRKAAQLEGEALEVWYRKAVDLLLLVQKRATTGFKKDYCFDTAAYDSKLALEREGRYFKEAFLQRYLNMKNIPTQLDHDLEKLSHLVERDKRKVFLHRDFQSRNIMIKNQRLYLIDFQGGRLGPPHYDLAALLWDPYVGLSLSLKERLFDYYAQEMGLDDKVRFREDFIYVGLHRAMQVLGAFGFLTIIKKKTFFEKYIPTAVRNLSAMASQFDCTPYPAFTQMLDRLRRKYV